MKQFKAAWERFAGDEANLTEFLQAALGGTVIAKRRAHRPCSC
jgi:hypothetical protein